ncbi:hypothetical protein [Flavobacterium beibuense]|uniref:hypothetical protein n=1 Tax=Flavobacterium beibuense TaxID=657326 RepID=UPI003A937E3E
MSKNFDKDQAVVKMVILTKSGKDNYTWYNFLKYNNRSTDQIISGMKRRFMESKLADSAQVLQFYNNKTQELIEEHR